MRWKEASVPDLVVRLRWALGVSLAVALVLPFVMGSWKPLVAFGLFLAIWVFAATMVGIRERLRNAPKGTKLARLAREPRGYWGMVLAHLGVAVFIVGVTLVNGYQNERDVRMEIGDTVTLNGYTFRFEGATSITGPNYRGARGTVDVSKDGRFVEKLYPEKRIYNVQQMPMTEAAIDSGILGDLYVSLGEPVGDRGAWAVRVYSKPFINWIWGGCVLMMIGGFLAISDRRYRLAVRRAPELGAAHGAAA
jgi:cytochrome c-type biogenesis protein CcmF